MVDNFTRIISPGVTRDSGTLYCKIVFTDGRLSITGVEGPKPGGDCRGACGQVIIHPWEFSRLNAGWSDSLVVRFRATWERWHLNDMQAGSPAQTAWIEANPLPHAYPLSHFDVYRDALRDAGLNPDPGHIINGKPYKYGSAWLRVNVPLSVLEFLQTLPEAVTEPAWI